MTRQPDIDAVELISARASPDGRSLCVRVRPFRAIGLAGTAVGVAGCDGDGLALAAKR